MFVLWYGRIKGRVGWVCDSGRMILDTGYVLLT